MKSLVLVGIAHSVMVSYLGPVFKLTPCQFNNMIFEKQPCVVDNISDMLIPFGTLSYLLVILINFIYFIDSDRYYLILSTSFAAVVSLSCYAYYLSTQENVECFSLGYYFVFISIAMLVYFMIVYKLNITRLLL